MTFFKKFYVPKNTVTTILIYWFGHCFFQSTLIKNICERNKFSIIFFGFRAVCVDAGQELSLRYSCQYYEVSAAESFAGVSLAFQSLLREARSVQLLKAMPIRRKLGVNSVSKVLGTIFGKNSSKRDRKKRPSLSIWSGTPEVELERTFWIPNVVPTGSCGTL